MRRTEIISAIVLVAFGLVLIAVIIPKYVAGGGQQVDLSPAFMPYVAAGIITTVMAILVVAKLTRRTPQDDEPTPMSPAAWLFIGLVAAIFAATYVVMSLFGFVLGGLVVVGSFMALARTRPIPLVVITVGFTVVVWLFVEKLMGIPLP
jgi:hypothetical protein